MSVFTGIVEEKGKIVSFVSPGSIEIEGDQVPGDIQVGESVCVSGVCLTVTKVSGKSFRADVTPETLKRTTLGELKVGSHVNLERAVKLGGRMGGHIVTGHVDCVGGVRSARRQEASVYIEFSIPREWNKYIVSKGSVAVDGVSLTIAEKVGEGFGVYVIPHTYSETSLGLASPSTKVNVEVDILAKYVEALSAGSSSRLEEALRRGGFVEMDSDV
ncbi:MAG: riboflavin synthase [Actinomycetota bacterium]|nr:riboflavin synthase [Actinomycetota bacterium]